MKLVGLMVAMTVVIVCPLAIYFPARQVEELRTALHSRAEVYARLMSQQLRSAVAFEDRETAREVIDALAKDPLTVGLAVYTAKGDALHRTGTLSELGRRAGRVVPLEAATYDLPGRILALAPVRSLEGARGTIVLELSTGPSRRMRTQLVLLALGIGAGALLCGGALAWLIARSLSYRIELIADATSAMAQGDLDKEIRIDGPNDEIGVLAHGFDAMRSKMQELVSHIRQVARDESARLERLVAQRTEQLDTKNRDLRLVLDNVEQGFVTIDRDARIVGAYSKVIENWLGPLHVNECFWQQLTSPKPQSEAAFAVGWEQVLEGLMPLEATLEQMPRRMELAGRHLSFEYRPLGGAEFERLLVVITDVTAVVAREASQQETRDVVNLTMRLLQDRPGFLEFVAEGGRLAGRIAHHRGDLTVLRRDVHTLKGNSALYGVQSVASACHRLETSLQQEDTESPPDGCEVVESWERCMATVDLLLGERTTSKMEIDETRYAALLAAMRADVPRAELERSLKAWKLEPFRERLQRVADQLTRTSARLGEPAVVVSVTSDDLYAAREELGEFWAAFAHVVRNAAVHGRRTAEQRAAQPNVRDFDLRAGVDQGELFVELSDRGPGIDWEGIRARASAQGMRHETQDDLQEALFADGVSTRSEVSDLAGRGVGLSAVRASCEERAGKVRVTTRRGAGTSFRFSWPITQFESLIHLDAQGAR